MLVLACLAHFMVAAGASPASRDRGGGGAKLKSGEQRFSPKCEGFFWPKSQIFRPKAGGLKKKKKKKERSSPKSEGFFWPKSQIFRPKAGDLQKKRSSPKSEGFFWPKSQILTFFPLKNTNFFLPKNTVKGQEKKIGGGGGKNENRGGIAPLPPRWRRAWVAG